MFSYEPYLNLSTATVAYWKIFNVDLQPVMNKIWGDATWNELWKHHFEGFTAKGGCLEGYQGVCGC